MKSGIYEIVNTVTGMTYVGSSSNVFRRWSKHMSDLRCGRHGNPLLQRDYNRHGADSFSFRILQVVPDKRFLLISEQICIDYRRPEYNINKHTESVRLGIPCSEEAKKKISRALTGRKRPLWVRQKLSEAAKKRAAGSRSGNLRPRSGKPVERVCPKTGEVVRYSSIVEVRKDGFHPSKVSEVCRGVKRRNGSVIRTHGGYRWVFVA